MRVARDPLPSYNVNWLINTNFYSNAISQFQELTSDVLPPAIDPVIQHLISNAVTSAIAAVMTSVQTKHKEEMLAIRKMIEKSLLLREFGSSTPPPDLNTSSKVFLPADLQLKSTKR